MALFESYERRIEKSDSGCSEGTMALIPSKSAAEVTKAAGLDVYKMVEGIQPICFENA